MNWTDAYLDAIEVHAGHEDFYGKEHHATRLALAKVLALAPPSEQAAIAEKLTGLGSAKSCEAAEVSPDLIDPIRVHVKHCGAET
jgi:hypothetical protein